MNFGQEAMKSLGDALNSLESLMTALGSVAIEGIKISKDGIADHDNPKAATMFNAGERIQDGVVEISSRAEEADKAIQMAMQQVRKYSEDIIKATNEKIAAAQQSDCHPKHNTSIRKQVWSLTGGKCAYCDTDLAPEGNGSLSFVVEHVVPTSQGGPDNLANYVPACMSCNTSKSADHVLLFIQRRFPNRMQRANPYEPERMA